MVPRKIQPLFMHLQSAIADVTQEISPCRPAALDFLGNLVYYVSGVCNS